LLEATKKNATGVPVCSSSWEALLLVDLSGVAPPPRSAHPGCCPYVSPHPGGNPGANLQSISHRCYPILVAFVWVLTKETIHLPLGGLQGGTRELCGGVPERRYGARVRPCSIVGQPECGRAGLASEVKGLRREVTWPGRREEGGVSRRDEPEPDGRGQLQRDREGRTHCWGVGLGNSLGGWCCPRIV